MAKPAVLATSPESAAPSAKPICCIVGTDEAATVSSPLRAPLMMRCATKAQQTPMPTPIPKIARYSRGTAESANRPAATSDTAMVSGPSRISRPCHASPAPATAIDAAVQPSEAQATP